MEAIRKFIDFCGPAVYVVMFLLAGYLVWKAGWSNIDLNLASRHNRLGRGAGDALGDRAGRELLLRPDAQLRRLRRYGKSFKDVKKGNFLGLPLNFLVFALLVVVTRRRRCRCSAS